MTFLRYAADSLTLLRGVIALVLPWLGLTEGAPGLSKAVYLLVAAWTSDMLDGPLARIGRHAQPSWLGQHDLHIDMAVALGLLGYMTGANFVTVPMAAAYFLFSSFVLWRYGFARSLGMLLQAPVYAYFIGSSLRHSPVHGWWLVAWIAVAIIVTWPRFLKEIVPEFLSGIRRAMGGRARRE